MSNEHQLIRALLRAWPFPRGAGRIIDRFFSELTFSSQTALVRTSDGFDITVFPNELIGRHIYLSGEFDRSIVEILCNFSEPNDVLLDVGANIGYVSSCFLHNVDGSSVIAVEPVQPVADLLTKNLNQFDRRKIYRCALSAENGEAWFELDRSNMGAGRLVTEIGRDTIRVETRTGDRMFAELGIDKLDLVKIDAEGHEESVIASCAKHLQQLQPRTIVYEGLESNDRIPQMLVDIGYQVFGLKKHLRKLSLLPLEGVSSFHEYVAVSKSRSIPTSARRAYGLR